MVAILSGEYLHLLSDGEFSAAVHRVLRPAAGSAARLSAPLLMRGSVQARTRTPPLNAHAPHIFPPLHAHATRRFPPLMPTPSMAFCGLLCWLLVGLCGPHSDASRSHTPIHLCLLLTRHSTFAVPIPTLVAHTRHSTPQSGFVGQARDGSLVGRVIAARVAPASPEWAAAKHAEEAAYNEERAELARSAADAEAALDGADALYEALEEKYAEAMVSEAGVDDALEADLMRASCAAADAADGA